MEKIEAWLTSPQSEFKRTAFILLLDLILEKKGWETNVANTLTLQVCSLDTVLTETDTPAETHNPVLVVQLQTDGLSSANLAAGWILSSAVQPR